MHVPPGRNVLFCLSALRRQAASYESSSLPVEEPEQEQEAAQRDTGAILEASDEASPEAETVPQEAMIQKG